jgi:hypothetical protein
MRAAINLAGALLWFPLNILVIARLLRAEWRRFPLIFAFVITEFLVAVAQFPTVWARVMQGTRETISWRVLFYQRGAVLLEFFTFIVVLSLIYRATAPFQSRKLVRAACVLGAILFVGLSFLIHYNPNIIVGEWMAPWERDLNVGTTILDLALWSLLLARRQKDYRLLLLSGALGIQFAGEAIGNSMRSLATQQHPWPSRAGGMIVVASGLVRVYMWARAFRQAPETPRNLVLDLPAQRDG